MALQERRASNPIALLLSSVLMRRAQTFVIGVFDNLQRPPLNVHPVVVRTMGMVLTQSSLGGPRVSLSVLVVPWSILTATTSQGERLGRPNSWACYGCD